MKESNKTYIINPDVEDDDIILSLALLFSVFLCGAILQFVTNLVKLGLPYTVVVFTVGMLMGLSGKQRLSVGPHLMLNAFLPILIFEGAFAMDVFVLRKVFWQALFLAGPGLVVITGLTATVAQPLMGSKDWGWLESLLFGSILSATDPVAVVALLKELGASPFLSLLIEGESLLNDGTAMVAFTVIYGVITGTASLTAKYVIVGGFLKFAVGGPLFGYVMARACLLWLNNTFNDPLSEISATLVAAFLTFFAAETFLHVSSVLALVVMGVVLSNNRTSISPEVETFLHSFWEALAYLANTLIFYLVGVIVTQLIAGKKSNPWDFVLIFIIYISVNSIRAMVIIFFSPLLKRIGYRLPWQFSIVASWSGLRGAVGLALALMVYETPESKIPKASVSYRVFLHLCGIVFLTLVINATTISKILDLLGMSGISDARRAAMATSLTVLGEIKHKTMSVWMTDRFLSDVDWKFVDNLCSLQEPWDLTQDEDEEKKMRVWAVCPHCEEDVPYQPTTKEMQDLRSEAILRLLKAQKLSYWRQFEHGMLSVVAVRTLHEQTETAADTKGQFIDVDVIKDTWKTTTLTKVVEWVRRQDMSRVESHGRSMVLKARSKTDEAGIRACCKNRPRSLRELLTRQCFVVTVAVVLYLALDLTVTSVNFILFMDDSPSSGIVSYVSAGLCGIMVLYAVLRFAVLGKLYLHSVWFWLSCLILVGGIVDLALNISLEEEVSKGTSFHQISLYVFLFLGTRLVRTLHALEALVPVVIMVLENQEVQRLSDGYDIGRGFVMGEEEIRGRIDHMADRKLIIDELRTHCDAAKMDILKCLGLLQKDNPEVAMGVKTRQAIRSVLNNLRDEIHTLLQEGVLEEAEGNDLAGMVESKMKQLVTAPPKVPLPSIEKILQNVPWIADNEDLVRFIQARARMTNYEYGDIIMRQDEPTTGVSIILSGLVKLEISIPVPMDSADGETKYITRVLDFMTSGNVLGEIGVLTGKPRSATVKCETGVQLLDISFDDIQVAFERFNHLEPPLKYRLWRLSAIRICTGIFLDQPSFQGMTKEKLRVRLENGYVEEIDQTPSTFPIFFHVGELVLLHGEAVDTYGSDRFEGPCYIPQQVQMLSFETHQSPNPALFILPTENCPAVCRPSISVAETALGNDDISKSTMLHAPLFVPQPGSHSVSTMGMDTSGMFKRTALHTIHEMNGKRASIQMILRRGSAYPTRLIKKNRLTGSASVTPFTGGRMTAEGLNLPEDTQTSPSQSEGGGSSEKKPSGTQLHTVSDPTLNLTEGFETSSRHDIRVSRSPVSLMDTRPTFQPSSYELQKHRSYVGSMSCYSNMSVFSTSTSGMLDLDRRSSRQKVNPREFYLESSRSGGAGGGGGKRRHGEGGKKRRGVKKSPKSRTKEAVTQPDTSPESTMTSGGQRPDLSDQLSSSATAHKILGVESNEISEGSFDFFDEDEAAMYRKKLSMIPEKRSLDKVTDAASGRDLFTHQEDSDEPGPSSSSAHTRQQEADDKEPTETAAPTPRHLPRPELPTSSSAPAAIAAPPTAATTPPAATPAMPAVTAPPSYQSLQADDQNSGVRGGGGGGGGVNQVEIRQGTQNGTSRDTTSNPPNTQNGTNNPGQEEPSSSGSTVPDPTTPIPTITTTTPTTTTTTTKDPHPPAKDKDENDANTSAQTAGPPVIEMGRYPTKSGVKTRPNPDAQMVDSETQTSQALRQHTGQQRPPTSDFSGQQE